MTKNNSVKVCPLASGSKGNSLYMAFGNDGILVDAGLSGIEVQRRMTQRDFSADSLKAIVITHEHSDHVRGAGVLSRRYNLPVYITHRTYQACSSLGKINDLRFFECGNSFKIGRVKVNPFSTSHDACDSAGLTFEFNNRKIGVATDLGVVTNLVKSHLMNSDLLYLESNHDPEMLISGPYPWHLKQRIKGRSGHLSNIDAADLVTHLLDDRLKHVILAHLSEENNCPVKAGNHMKTTLNGANVRVHVATPDQPGEVIVI